MSGIICNYASDMAMPRWVVSSPGQANQNFSDPDANGEVLDFGGPIGQAGLVRVPQVRYTLAGPWGSAWSASIETPETDIMTPVGPIFQDTATSGIGTNAIPTAP